MRRLTRAARCACRSHPNRSSGRASSSRRRQRRARAARVVRAHRAAGRGRGLLSLVVPALHRRRFDDAVDRARPPGDPPLRGDQSRKVYVDNNPCEAEIYPVSGAALMVDDNCGFIAYVNDTDNATMRFKARQPHHYATFWFETYRANSVGVPEATCSGRVGADAGGFTCSPVHLAAGSASQSTPNALTSSGHRSISRATRCDRDRRPAQ
jgi:hypothetical protein